MAQLATSRLFSFRTTLSGWRTLSSHKAYLSTSNIHSSNGLQGAGGQEKLYELRTYAIKPDRFGEFTKLMQEGCTLRTAHSKLIGYWNTDLGGVNEVVHIWEYDSYAHRSGVRKALAQDKNWVEKCFSKILPMFDSQTNVVMKGFPWYNLQLDPTTRDAGSVYELVNYHVKPGMIPQFEHRLLQEFTEIDYNPLGLWYSVFGDIHRVYSLLRYDNLDQREELLTKAMENRVIKETVRDLDKFLDGTVTKALVPVTFSPLQ